MGWTLEDISKGAGDIGNILGQAAETWQKFTGAATPPIAATNQPVTQQPATNPQEQWTGAKQASAGMNWLIVLGVLFLVVVLIRPARR